MGPVGPRHNEILTLVRELRALGATRVRLGDFEAAFSAPAEPEVAAPPKRAERVSLSTAEWDELDDLRAMRRRAEELGVAV